MLRKSQFRLSVNNKVMAVIPCSAALSVMGLTESGEKIRVGRLAGRVGTVGLAVAVAPVGITASVVLVAASGFVRVSFGVELVTDATTRLDAVM